MAFFVNIGYTFKLPATVDPDGSVLLSSAMPMHQLERRRIDERYPHMQHLLFDPQLYLAGLDAAASRQHCTKLATYPWFGIAGLQEFRSDEHTQAGWRQSMQQQITGLWPGASPTNPEEVENGVREAVDFQRRLGCQGVILPAPLTVDPSTDYRDELLWLDSALDYVRGGDVELPVYATIALADICVRYTNPSENQLLDLILDSVSARGVDGVYIVLEQGSEAGDTRQCGNTRSLASVLRLVHVFSDDVGLQVGVNFVGPFGLACEAAGATWWASGWYKSLCRLRLADRLAGGRAYPSYWSYPCEVDVHLDGDFDALVGAGMLDVISDSTSASIGLLQAAQTGLSTDDVPAWRYAQSNIAAATEHFLLSAIHAERLHADLAGPARLDFAQEWLAGAAAEAANIASVLGRRRRTKIDHVEAWRDAFGVFRTDHNL